jgi:hypothetical protein
MLRFDGAFFHPFRTKQAMLTFYSHGGAKDEDMLINRLTGLFHELSSAVNVYPSLQENYRDSQKFHVVQDLDTIAAQITMTARPRTSRNRDAIPGKEIVMKRTASAYGDHVFFRPAGKAPPRVHSAYHFYFFQELVPSLLKAGEVRVFIVNGNEVIHRVATTPIKNKSFRFWEVNELHPLCTWRQQNRYVSKPYTVASCFHLTITAKGGRPLRCPKPYPQRRVNRGLKSWINLLWIHCKPSFSVKGTLESR